MIKILTVLSFLILTSVACNKKKEDEGAKIRDGRNPHSTTNGGTTQANNCNQSLEQSNANVISIIESLSNSPIVQMSSSDLDTAARYILNSTEYNQITKITFSMRFDRANQNNSKIAMVFWDDYAFQNQAPLYVAFGSSVCGFRVQQQISGSNIVLAIFDSYGAIEVNGVIQNNTIYAEIYYHNSPTRLVSNPRLIGQIQIPANGIIY